MSESDSLCPARPRANAMHIFDEDGVAAGGVVTSLRDTSRRDSSSLSVCAFCPASQLSWYYPLHLPAPDKFPTTMQMETIVRAIVAT